MIHWRATLLALVGALAICLPATETTVTAQEATPAAPAAGTDPFDPAVAEATPIPGVETFAVSSAAHTTEPVAYPRDPPAGGPHDPSWQKCAVYEAPVKNEHAVHSQEHGAVWITYRPDLPDADREALEALAEDQPAVLVSPYPGLEEPAVASAWGAQLRVDDVHDPRLQQFIERYAGQGPEPGASCVSGVETTVDEG